MNFLVKKKKERKKPKFEGCEGCGSGDSKIRVTMIVECENCGRKKVRSAGIRVLGEPALPEMREG